MVAFRAIDSRFSEELRPRDQPLARAGTFQELEKIAMRVQRTYLDSSCLLGLLYDSIGWHKVVF